MEDKGYFRTKILFINQKFFNVLVISIIISSFTYLTFERNKVWQDDITLWKDSVEKAPDNARAYNNLGRAYGAKGLELDAIDAFKKAIALLPTYAIAHMNIAVSYSRLGKNSEAELHYKKAIYFYPELPEIYYNFGFFLYSTKRYEEAYTILNKYVRLDPTGVFIPFTYQLLSDIEKKAYEK
jgi:Tfp pilus assembly protein PilF